MNTFPAHPKLDEHELFLAQMQFADFRSANLFRMLTHHDRPGTVLDVGCGGGMVAWLVEHGHDARGIDLNADTVAAARRFLASRGRDPIPALAQDAKTLQNMAPRADKYPGKSPILDPGHA